MPKQPTPPASKVTFMPNDRRLPPRVRFAFAEPCLTATMWHDIAPDELTHAEYETIRCARHFGLPVLWGFVSHDPHGMTWPVTEPRPVVPLWQAVHVGDC